MHLKISTWATKVKGCPLKRHPISQQSVILCYGRKCHDCHGNYYHDIHFNSFTSVSLKILRVSDGN